MVVQKKNHLPLHFAMYATKRITNLIVLDQMKETRNNFLGWKNLTRYLVGR